MSLDELSGIRSDPIFPTPSCDESAERLGGLGWSIRHDPSLHENASGVQNMSGSVSGSPKFFRPWFGGGLTGRVLGSEGGVLLLESDDEGLFFLRMDSLAKGLRVPEVGVEFVDIPCSVDDLGEEDEVRAAWQAACLAKGREGGGFSKGRGL